MLLNTDYAVFDLSRPDEIVVCDLHVFLVCNAQMSVLSTSVSALILDGDTPLELVSAYSLYSGRMRPLPDWIMNGFVFSFFDLHDVMRRHRWLGRWDSKCAQHLPATP